MKKVVLFLICLILTIPLIAEEALPEAKEEGLSMGGGVGTVQIGGTNYAQIRLLPEITIGKLGIGLDIELLIDNDGNIRKEDWNEWEDILNKIYYIRYGHRGDNFYGRIGGFPQYSLGPGLVMKNYSNMVYYPEYKKIGLQLGGKIPTSSVTMEAFVSDILEQDIFAGRVTVKPLSATNFPLIENIKLGGTIAHDRNQYKGLLDSDGDGYPDVFDDYPHNPNKWNEVDENIDEWWAIFQEIVEDATYEEFEQWFWHDSAIMASKRNPSFDDLGEASITAFGIDYELPLIQTQLFYLSNYAEFAQIVDHNWGLIFPGFYSQFLIFHMNLEFRHYQDKFIPSYFDSIYESQRAAVVGDTVRLKETLIENATQSRGWYGSLTSNILNMITLTVSYEDMYGKDKDNRRSIWGTLALKPRLIPGITRAELNYSQTRVRHVLREFKTPSSMISGTAGYMLAPNTELVARYQERYVDLDGDGKISGPDETIKTFSMGVEFRF